jgi:uncharacterized RDD family membrane protein YckC
VCVRDAWWALLMATPSSSPSGVTESSSVPTYAGFWVRLGAMLVDSLLWLPLGLVALWGDLEYRLFDVYALIPAFVLNVGYNVWMVARFGGTPGKIWLRMRIQRTDGRPIGFGRAFVRHAPELFLYSASALALCIPLLGMSDEGYAELLPHFTQRRPQLETLAPIWYRPVEILYIIWVYAEFIVLLTNKKRRALHDFLAGTVVVRQAGAE